MVVKAEDKDQYTEYGYRGLEEIRALQEKVEKLQKRIEELESDDIDPDDFKLGLTDPD
tara:strand:+ start:42 stop:215 length:174 start_codon:yes stop_codon:yes gene_type:complete